MEYTRKITLDVNASDNGRMYAVKQGDKLLRKLEITLLSDGVPFVPTGVSNSQFRCSKPDGNAVIVDDVQNTGNVWTIPLSEQAICVSGHAVCDLALYDSAGNCLSSCTFVLDITPMPEIGSTIKSTTEWQRLMDAIAEAESIVGSNIAFRVEGENFEYSTDGGTTWKPLTQFISITNAQIDALF